MKAYGKKVIVRVEDPKHVTEGGIHLPDHFDEAGPRYGVVVSVGNEVRRVANSATEAALQTILQSGQRIAYKTHAGLRFKHEGKAFDVLESDDILFIL